MERVLAIGYGNPGRLDDGLGPALAEILSEQDLPGVTVEANYQLTVEDAAAISEHDFVVFVDASVGGPEPFSFQHVTPDAEATVSFSTHSIEPAALLALSRDLFGADTPGYVLGVRGYAFDEFGERLSRGAAANLAAALQFLVPVLRARSMAVAAGAAAQRAAPPHPTGDEED